MSTSRVNWSMLLVAIALLVPVAVGVVLVLGGSAPLGWALVGFFGAGAVVLAKQAITGS
ncbi:hypothetical protein [Nocardioides sp. YIM 152315]|uniref:hypothetical protein n=1 Tax=Nocardioides sp. YIM 152315 TaxID=3031760 RepID=UPI0023DA8130|nr:hypothetical protein [Nocardioides sp. YIM 152315]MDF1605726.1 hypothetical protein [Nocardioides sp. YIM 152315]